MRGKAGTRCRKALQKTRAQPKNTPAMVSFGSIMPLLCSVKLIATRSGQEEAPLPPDNPLPKKGSRLRSSSFCASISCTYTLKHGRPTTATNALGLLARSDSLAYLSLTSPISRRKPKSTLSSGENHCLYLYRLADRQSSGAQSHPPPRFTRREPMFTG